MKLLTEGCTLLGHAEGMLADARQQRIGCSWLSRAY